MKNNLYELEDTVELMLSTKWKDRFMAEFYQLCIRKNSLENLLRNYDKGFSHCAINRMPNCDVELLRKQLEVMTEYVHILEQRGDAEMVWYNEDERPFSGSPENDNEVPEWYIDLTDLLNSAGT